MPSAERLSLFRTIRSVETPQIDSFEIIQDSKFLGYKTRIRWNYDDDNIVGFRVWRAISKKVLLKKNYLIPQVALERLSGLKSFYVRNTTLFNKQYFSQNSKVDFFQSNSTRFVKTDEEPEIDFHRFSDIGFIRKNRQVLGGARSNQYEFIDKRIRFGETYIYIISALTTGLFESKKSRPVTARVEDLVHPDAPKKINLAAIPVGVLINIDVKLEAKDVYKFVIHRREEEFEEDFKEIAEINADELNIVNFLDGEVIPGRAYYYKVYSKDYYGNLSFSAEQHRVRYDSKFIRKGDIPHPDVTFTVDSGKMIISGMKNSDDVIGYRYERKDVWRFEEAFEIKNVIGIPWPNVNLFDSSGSAKLIDETVTSGSVYQYRATAIKKNGIGATFLLTPPIRIANGFVFPEPAEENNDFGDADLTSFSVAVEDTKQKPIFSKFSWEIKGEWSYLLIDIIKGFTFEGSESTNPTSGSLRVDNVHEDNSIYTTELELGNSYEMRVRVFDGEGDLLDETTESQVTRISI